MVRVDVQCAKQMRNPILTVSFNANLLCKSGMNWHCYMASLMLFFIQLKQPSNGGVGKENHGGRSFLLCCGAHGGGEIIKSSKNQNPPQIYPATYHLHLWLCAENATQNEKRQQKIERSKFHRFPESVFWWCWAAKHLWMRDSHFNGRGASIFYIMEWRKGHK